MSGSYPQLMRAYDLDCLLRGVPHTLYPLFAAELPESSYTPPSPLEDSHGARAVDKLRRDGLTSAQNAGGPRYG